ncbi:MAG: ABC transporter ATP-binding protein [Oscillospiraceae bacterium]|jgi:ABC-type multidrug transport system ATPase subunit|nr:ABC transporter ATP-binding protein [Oscillospiraceae bacterium]
MLSVSNVTKRFGKTLANDHVSLDAKEGRITVLLGPNGAGKSTLIKSVAGLLRFEGEITIGSHSSKTLAAKRLLGYIPEMPAVYDLLTVREHLSFIRRAYRLPVDDSFASWENETLDRFEMTENRDKLGRELSKGMQQKLSILCALAHEPKLIIFDEPLVGLDPHAIKELKKIFVELRESGVALFISTHMIDSMENLWDTAHILMRGRVAATLSSENRADLETLFFSITESGRERESDEYAGMGRSPINSGASGAESPSTINSGASGAEPPSK